jgi:hypothetical protein
MKIFFYCFTFYYLACKILCQEISEDEEVVEEKYNLVRLDRQNYAKYTIDKNLTHFLVLFHNPWCKFSQSLEKKLTKVNKLLKTENQNFFIGELDTTLEDAKSLVKEMIPSSILEPFFSYPKLVYYYKNSPVELYKGKHNKLDIYYFLKRKIHPGVIEMPIISIFDLKTINDKNAFVYFGNTETESQIFQSAAEEHKDFIFYRTNEEKVYEKLNPEKKASVIYYSFGVKKDEISKSTNMTSQILNKFIKKNTNQNFYVKLNEDFINEVFMKKQAALILFRNEYDNKTLFLEENFPLIAKAQPSIKFLVTDLTGKLELKLANVINVGQSLPSIRLLDFKNGLRRFEMTREPTMENVVNFLKMYKTDKLQPYTISQSSQVESQKKHKLLSFTTANFYETVIFNRKNVIVFFLTDWCTHCKKVKNINNLVNTCNRSCSVQVFK